MENIWSSNDDPVTDPSKANDYVIETAIEEFQYSVKTITDMAVSLSSDKQDLLHRLSVLQDALHEAYTHLLDNNNKKAISVLRKVVR